MEPGEQARRARAICTSSVSRGGRGKLSSFLATVAENVFVAAGFERLFVRNTAFVCVGEGELLELTGGSCCDVASVQTSAIPVTSKVTEQRQLV